MPEPPSIPYGLPRACYARHPTTGETIVLIRGQAGYWPADATGTPEQLNAELEEPPTQAQIEAMLGKSMFGWAEPVPDPKPAPALSQGPDPGDTADWGEPDTPYKLKDGSTIWPLPLAMFDPLRALSGGHLGLYGWLGVVDRRHPARLDLDHPRPARARLAGPVRPPRAARRGSRCRRGRTRLAARGLTRHGGDAHRVASLHAGPHSLSSPAPAVPGQAPPG